MEIKTALTLELGQLQQPVVTNYHVGTLMFRLYQAKVYRGEKLGRIQKEMPERSDYTRLITTLLHDGILQSVPDIPNKEVFALLGQTAAAAQDIACCVDPFCYISHMSAMEYHGLTDRLPKILFLTTLPSPQWSRAAAQQMEKDLGSEQATRYREARLPALRRLRLEKIHRKTVNAHTSKHCNPGAYLTVQGRALRVSTLGRTFLDMIREPDLCGGIYHVLDVYGADAGRYLGLIVDEIDSHGNKLDKVRAGYILEERLGLSHPSFAAWQALGQRGGSQKLHAQAAYSSRFSEKWCLSINIEEAMEV